jgi:hypothetical protein
MLWHASSEPQRHLPRGEAGVSAIGRPVYPAASDKPNLSGRRT